MLLQLCACKLFLSMLFAFWPRSESFTCPISPPTINTQMHAEREHVWMDPEPMPPSLAAFKSKMEEEVLQINKSHGGPAQYLQSLSQGEKDEFAQYLWTEFPERDDLLYHTSATIPSVSDAELSAAVPVTVHIASLGFSADCSLKPAPGADISVQLAAQILQDGFVTVGEPLLVVQSQDPANYKNNVQLWGNDKTLSLGTFSLGYLKGMARVSSALALLYRVFILKIDLQSVHPVFHESARSVTVHHIALGSKLEEALQNVKLSARGSIRKKTNIIQVVVMVKKLYQHGLHDFTVFVRRWNGMSAKGDHIAGKRAMALKLLFDVAPEAG